jgi:hypothetical protein
MVEYSTGYGKFSKRPAKFAPHPAEFSAPPGWRRAPGRRSRFHLAKSVSLSGETRPGALRHRRCLNVTAGVMELLGRLLCWLGFHDYRVVEASFSFGSGGGVETVECRRCGYRMTRHGGE